MITFEAPGKDNTDETLSIALEYAMDHDLDIVVATCTGATALTLLEMAKVAGYTGRIIAVSHVYGMAEPGRNELPEPVRQELEAAGVTVVTAAHALSGGERGMSKRFGGVSPLEVVAHALRMFGQGTKVCVEIALMALDCGSIPYGRPVVAVGGTAYGADTACVLTPSYTANLLDTRVHTILCKPWL